LLEYSWAIVNHVCRVCSGRILQRIDANGQKYVRCSECGTNAIGDHRVICCCGAKLKDGRNAGLRCVENNNKTPEIPVDMVVEFVGEEKRSRIAPSNPSWIGTKEHTDDDLWGDDND
jgi:hypothetical protein